LAPDESAEYKWGMNTTSDPEFSRQLVTTKTAARLTGVSAATMRPLVCAGSLANHHRDSRCSASA
jgi:hypothetical protein